MLGSFTAIAMGIAMAIDLHFGGSYHALITVGVTCLCLAILRKD